MIYCKFGIKLNLLKEADLEMVRQWRNDPVVARNYEFRDYITPEMQKEWFKTINNLNNLYMVIGYRGEKLGVINMKNIDWDHHTSEGGIFIPDPKYHQTAISAILSFIATELQFKFFNGWVGYARIMKDNKAGRAFVMSVGYNLCPGQKDNKNQLYFCTKETFEKNSQKIKKAIGLLTIQDEPSVFIIERSEFEDEFILQWERRFLTFIKPDKQETIEAGRIYYFT